MRLILFLAALSCLAETRTLSLKQAVDLALEQNPEMILARLDEIKANQAIRAARDPYIPKIYVGSGLAYTYGFPMSIDGSAPSLVQARAAATIFDKSKSLKVAEERENARTARIGTDARREEVAERVALAYLDADRAARLARVAAKQIDALTQVLETAKIRVSEGRAIRLDEMRASLERERARERARLLESDARFAQTQLSLLIGGTADDRIETSADLAPLTGLPDSEAVAVRQALENSTELKRLQSTMLAQGFSLQTERAARLPKIELVAQYGLFARFNNFDQYFNRFQKNNGQLGMSFQLPVLGGTAPSAAAATAQAEISRLRTEVGKLRNRTSYETQRAYQAVNNAEHARELARLELEVQRENVAVTLARQEGGRATLAEVEQARFAEGERWIVYYDTQHQLERAKVALLRWSGTLLVALR
ncbi:MAG: TolC family protein [Bryobacteraceae bacterium]|nr:TolC family protein [Bryobacteraceae bacterium]